MSSSDAVGLSVYVIIMIISIAACFLLAIIPSKIAKKKGYSGVGFYFFGLAALVPAIIVASVLRNRAVAPQPQPQATIDQQPIPPQE